MSSPNNTSVSVSEPFPIFKLAHRFILYDPDTIAHVRAKYNICGVLIGGLPQAPQQNIFLGVPLELMPEEARVLVEKGVAFIEDDTRNHKSGFLQTTKSANGDLPNALDADERRAYQNALRKQGQAAANQATKKTEDRRNAALSKLNASSGDWNDIPEDMFRPASNSNSRSTSRGPKRKGRAHPRSRPPTAHDGASALADDELLFGSSASVPVPDLPAAVRPSPDASSRSQGSPYAVTPTTSYPPLKPARSLGVPPPPRSRSTSPRPADEHEMLDDASSSYPLFKHLHSKGYFMAPGLRFGCQYVAYPGDPLRFHSHFLCNGMQWDEEFDLLHLIGGGRLGTGVKKGYLIGGRDESSHESKDGEEESDARAFCIEWGGM